MADFSLEGVTKKRLGGYHRGQRELGPADDRVPAEAGADCRDVRGEASPHIPQVFLQEDLFFLQMADSS